MTQKTINQALFKPRSVAVVGASRSPHKIGYQLLKNLIESDYPGNIYPINPNASSILNHRVYPQLEALPQVPDLVLIVTPAPLVLPIIQSASTLGVKLGVIISAGFAESGPEGKQRQQELESVLKKSQLRVIGPNCLGLVIPHLKLNAAFGPSKVPAGNIFLISQSGALITSIFDFALSRNLGFSYAFSLGNRCDLNEVDLLRLAETDPHSQVIAIYLESFSAGRKFFEAASQITPHKPILFLKGGASAKGAVASTSHTGALATDAVLVSALCRQVGVEEFKTIESWLSACHVLSLWPKGYGANLGLITNAGGPGVLTTDYGSKLNFVFPNFSPLTRKKLSKLGLAVVSNPLDLLGDAPPENVVQAVSLAQNESALDSFYGIITPQSNTQPVQIARKLAAAFPTYKKPFAISFLGGHTMSLAKKITLEAGIPTFDFPNDGLEAFKTAIDIKANHNLDLSLSHLTPKSLTKSAAPQSQPEYFALLKKQGFILPRQRYVADLESLPETLAYIGRPAIAKTADPRLAHKAVVGGVVKDIMTVSQARLAFRKLQKLYPQVLFQQTIHAPVELILSSKRDPQLGLFVVVGLGGGFTDFLGDRTYIFTPVSMKNMLRLCTSSKWYQILLHESVPFPLIYQAVTKLNQLMLNHPQITEIEINPLLITKAFVYPVDIKLTF